MDKEKIEEYARLIGGITGIRDPRPDEEIAELVESGRQTELRAFELYRYAASLARAGEIDRAEQVAALIKDDDDVRGQALAVIADGMTKVGLLDKARAILDSIAVNLANPAVESMNIAARSRLAEAYGKVGNTEDARAVLNQAETLIRSAGPTDYAKADWFFTLARAWPALDDRKRAHDLWSEAFSDAQNSLKSTQAAGGNGFDEHQLLLAIIRSMAEFGMSDEARVFASSIEAPSWQEKARKLIRDVE